jgi:hypothetical protein
MTSFFRLTQQSFLAVKPVRRPPRWSGGLPANAKEPVLSQVAGNGVRSASLLWMTDQSPAPPAGLFLAIPRAAFDLWRRNHGKERNT